MTTTSRAHLQPVQPGGGRLRPVAGEDVAIAQGFWAERQRLNGDAFLAHCDAWITRMGWIENFDKAAQGRSAQERRGKVFTDSDVYKFLEALVWELGRRPTAELERRYQQIAAAIVAAQEPDGYLNTYFGHRGPEARYTDLSHGHELYCAGHLFQAAVARLRTHGPDALTDAALRLADRVCEDFGPDGIDGSDGHPEVELGLVELARATGEDAYLEQAKLFLERRGRRTFEHHPIGHEYYQDDMPIREATVFRGHVVRALYLAAAAVDIAVDTGDDALLQAVVRQWDATLARRTYITGGMGSRHLGESFGNDYELPPDRAYTETCGAVAAVMVAWRLTLATGEARFGDAIERTLYNMVATAVNPEGNRFFYVNPLLQRQPGIAVGDEEVPFRKDTLRAPWFWVSCCPTNWSRLVATLGAYVATTDDDGIQLHQYVTGDVATTFGGGRRARLHVATAYPWAGTVRVRIEETDGAPWELRLRVPAWADHGARVLVGEDERDVGPGFVTLRRSWRPGDTVVLELPMAPRFVRPDPRIDAVRDTVAVERGPLVYCLESPDLPAGVAGTDAVAVDPDGPLRDHPGTVPVDPEAVAVRVRGRALTLPPAGAWPYGVASATPGAPVDLTLVPYFLWSNRGPSTMRVWIPAAPEDAGSRAAPAGERLGRA